MNTPLRTLLCAALLSLSGALSATAATPLVQAEQPNVFATWTPNQLAKTQSTVDVRIQLPYRGDHNNWIITFSGSDGSYYYFTTNSSSNPDNNLYPLGTIAEGTYEVHFENQNSRDAHFEYWVGCNDYWIQGNSFDRDKTIYNVEFYDNYTCKDIYIDANY